MMVRAAVLKMKDPRQIIRDMEKLDEMGEDARICVNSVYSEKSFLYLTLFFQQQTSPWTSAAVVLTALQQNCV